MRLLPMLAVRKPPETRVKTWTKRKSRYTDLQILEFKDNKISAARLGSGGLSWFFSILPGKAFVAK